MLQNRNQQNNRPFWDFRVNTSNRQAQNSTTGYFPFPMNQARIQNSQSTDGISCQNRINWQQTQPELVRSQPREQNQSRGWFGLFPNRNQGSNQQLQNQPQRQESWQNNQSSEPQQNANFQRDINPLNPDNGIPYQDRLQQLRNQNPDITFEQLGGTEYEELRQNITNLEKTPEVSSPDFFPKRADIAQTLHRFAQNERNGAAFYSHLHELSREEKNKEMLRKMSDDAKKNSVVHFELCRKLLPEAAELREPRIDRTAGFENGLRMAVREESLSLRELCELFEIMTDPEDMKKIHILVHKKISDIQGLYALIGRYNE